jgi:SpoVK/Ycf46/Vps4 family AAA+-type ATPase
VQRELDLAIAWAAGHGRMYGAWGLSTGVARARGVTGLFAGPPGTGKTLAAQILAGAIDRDLFRVDLSQAVSKWLGETEKNLGRLFDEAEDAGAVLFFDEADALFARRTEVRDSHDRYANLETGYLLQRLESHEGIVVLATNRRQDLDTAFQRRFDVIIEFAPPGVVEREQLWRHHLPASARCAPDLDPARLAQLFELSGGQIRNAVITSVAATAMGLGRPLLAMPALIGGATRELVRAGRLVNPADYGAWAPAVRAALGIGADAGP